MSEEERIRRAEIIAQRRNSRIPANSINNREKNRISTFAKVSIQIIMSICIFGIFYFLYQNNSYALEVIKPIISTDTDFKALYSNINEAVKNIIKDENFESKNKQQMENTEINDNSEKKDEQNKEEAINLEETEDNEDDVAYIKRMLNFIKPIEGTITSRFGERESTEIVSANHAGIDIGAEEGTEIKSAMDGIADKVSEDGGYGKYIIIKNNEISTLYAHCSEILISEGEEIKQGRIIAKVGSTGKSTGPHLHFEIRRKDNSINPEEILKLE